MSADIGLIGLAVMGENLVLNMESHGFTVAVYNRTTARVDEFLAGRGKGLKVCVLNLLPTFSLDLRSHSMPQEHKLRCLERVICRRSFGHLRLARYRH